MVLTSAAKSSNVSFSKTQVQRREHEMRSDNNITMGETYRDGPCTPNSVATGLSNATSPRNHRTHTAVTHTHTHTRLTRSHAEKRKCVCCRRMYFLVSCGVYTKGVVREKSVTGVYKFHRNDCCYCSTEIHNPSSSAPHRVILTRAFVI